MTAADEEKLQKLIQSFEAPNDPPQNEVIINFENQHRQHFESLMNAELHFAAAVCEMSTRERRFLKEASTAWLKAALRKYAVGQHQIQKGAGRFVVIQNGNRIVRRQGADAALNPSAMITDGIRKTCEAILPPDVFANYQQELQLRTASRRTAAAQAMIVELDSQLVLTAEQRERMLARLLENWNDQWNHQLPAFVQGGQFIPQIPREIVIEILTEDQKKLYARASQVRRQAVFAPVFPAVNMNIQGRVFNIEIDD